MADGPNNKSERQTIKPTDKINYGLKKKNLKKTRILNIIIKSPTVLKYYC
jgi:hypothetical protein